MEISRKPLVSIWIPTYNGGHLISKAIESSLRQTYSNIEVIVFDDASKDNTKSVVEEYVGRDKRVRYFRTETNIGINKSYPKILEKCSGEFSLFLCCDDWLSNNFIEECVKTFMHHPGAGAVTGRVFSIFEKNGEWVFSREPEVRSGRYSRHYFGIYAYRNFITSMIILGMVRTKDALEAVYWLNNFIDNPPLGINNELRALMGHEYGSEFIFCAKVMAKYDYLYVSEKAVLLKTENPSEHYMANKGSMKLRAEFGLLDNTAKSFFKFHYFTRKLYDEFFKEDWKEYISPMRIFFAEDAIARVISEVIKNHFSSNFLKGFSLRDFGMLFEGYSLYEKFLSIILSPYRVMVRWAHWLSRRLFKKSVPNIYKSEYFLNTQKQFTL